MAERFVRVEVEIAKVRDYCLSEVHPRGRHKARVFRSVLGITAADAEELRRALLDAVRDRVGDVTVSATDEYGTRYVLDFEMTTAVGRATVRSAWIVLTGDDVLRLATCYVLL